MMSSSPSSSSATRLRRILSHVGTTRPVSYLSPTTATTSSSSSSPQQVALIRKKVILDVDTGVDDAWAIAMALLSPELEVLAITCVAGNVHVNHVVKNTLRVIALVHHHYPSLILPGVARGAEHQLVPLQPLVAGMNDPKWNGENVFGNDGMGDLGDDYYPSVLPYHLVVSEPADKFIAQLVAKYAHDVTIVCTAPSTNIANAIIAYPLMMAMTKQIVVMAATINERGNVPPLLTSEFNAFRDPHALTVVLQSAIPVVVCPLDATHRVLATKARWLDEVKRSPTPIMKFLHVCAGRFLSTECDKWQGACLHDPLALAIVIDPTLVEYASMRLYVETKPGATEGLTIPYRAYDTRWPPPPNCRIAMNVPDVERVLTFFFRRIAGDHIINQSPVNMS